MNMPKFHETFMPILRVLEDGEIKISKLAHLLVREKFYKDISLEKKLLSKNIPLILDRIQWGCSYLKLGKFVCYPKRSSLQITPKGKQFLDSGKHLTYDLLRKDSDYKEYQANKNQKSTLQKKGSVQEDKTPIDLIDDYINKTKGDTKLELLEKLKSVDFCKCKLIIEKIFKKMGYGNFIETSKIGDGEIEGILNEDKLGLEKIYIQVKSFKDNKVKEKDMRNFLGSMQGNAQKGIFVTTSSFTSLAKEKAKKGNIILIDGDKLIDLMYEYEIGVRIKNLYKVKKIDEDFFE